ncbi:MAG: NADH-quinone oxidoreductase subunit [Ramlibacter sp.]|jgi:formate dehydrogenase|nr:NADH-quinone oxidoreductase subunit [Ramlibacter sp.]
MGDTVAPLRFHPRSTPKGRQADDSSRGAVHDSCAGLEPSRDLLIEHLHRLQDCLGALSRPHLVALAERLKMAQAEVYEVATFYDHFEVVDDLREASRVTVRVCTSLPCAMAGSERLLAAVRAQPGVRFKPAPCLGRCHQAPAACIGQHEMGHATAVAIDDALAQGDTGARPLPHATRLQEYTALGGYQLLAACHRGDRPPESVITELEEAGLRGLGGAGFPAARKWRTVAAQLAPRHMVVNIDEGEVGTFKDGHLLATDPHRVLEGALIAAWAVGAERIWLYVRDEYHAARNLLVQEVAALQERPPVGNLPAIEIRRGAGAYICGEESALIESIEGKRGWPRLRPPIVAQVGVFGRPTLAHNLETMWWIRDVVEGGGAAWAARGRRGRTGLRRFSVSGRVARPGVHLAPAGITLRELIEEHAGGMLPGHELYGFLPGGASGGILPATAADVPLDFDTLAEYGAFVGSMGVIVLSQHDRARDAAANLMSFFEHESCGQCTPCREGTRQASLLMAQRDWDTDLMADISNVMRDASICGLGQAAPNPMDSVVRFFRHEIQS